MVVHQALKQKSKFYYTNRLRDLNAAQAWGCSSPHDFDALPMNAKLDIIAWYEARWRINAIQSWDDAEEAKRKK